MEVRVIPGARRQPPILVAELVKEIEAVTSISQHRAGAIIDLDRMRGAERMPVLDRQLRPRRMSDGDEGAGLPRSLRQLRGAFVRLGWGKVERQPGCDNMPILAGAGRHGVNLGADQSGERLATQLAGV